MSKLVVLIIMLAFTACSYTSYTLIPNNQNSENKKFILNNKIIGDIVSTEKNNEVFGFSKNNGEIIKIKDINGVIHDLKYYKITINDQNKYIGRSGHDQIEIMFQMAEGRCLSEKLNNLYALRCNRAGKEYFYLSESEQGTYRGSAYSKLVILELSSESMFNQIKKAFQL